MGGNILQGLPTDADQAMTPKPALNVTQNPAFAASTPQVPASTVPMRPADQQGQDAAPPDVKPDPVHDMASAFINHLISKDEQAQRPDDAGAPGSFKDKMQGAMSAIGAGLGDMRTGGDPSKGHGWLSAVGDTLNARNERTSKEAQIKFERDERLKADAINNATANANLIAHSRNVQFQKEAQRHADAADGQQWMDHVKDGGTEVQTNINNAQFQKIATENPGYLKTHTYRITGYEPVLDAEGEPKMKDEVVDGKTIKVRVESPLYSLAAISPEDAATKMTTITPAIAKKWKDAGVTDVSAGSIMPLSVANKHDVDALALSSTVGIINADKLVKMPDDVKIQISDALQDRQVAHAVAMNPGQPLGGLYQAQDNVQQHITAAQQNLQAAQASGNQQAAAAAQDDLKHAQTTQQAVDKAINMGFTDDERKTYVKEKQAAAKQDAVETQNAARDAETTLHNRNMEAIERAKLPSATPEDTNAGADALLTGNEDPSQLSKRAKGYQPTINAAMQMSWDRYGKPWSAAQASSDYKFANAPATQNTLKYLNSLTGGPGVQNGGNLGELVKQSDKIKRTEFPALNDAAAWARLQAGDPDIVAYHTVVTEVADQVAKILQGGSGGSGTSDAKLKQAQDMFANGFTKDQIKSVASELNPLLANRQKGLIGSNRYLQSQYYGPQGLTSTMIAPNGQKTEIPQSQVDFYKSKGAHIQTKDEYYKSLPVPPQQ